MNKLKTIFLLNIIWFSCNQVPLWTDADISFFVEAESDYYLTKQGHEKHWWHYERKKLNIYIITIRIICLFAQFYLSVCRYRVNACCLSRNKKTRQPLLTGSYTRLMEMRIIFKTQNWIFFFFSSLTLI